MKLPKEFKEFLRLLKIREVRYLLVGGYAVSFHGYPRPTGDLDIWISRDSGNVDNIVEALCDFGFGRGEVSPEIFSKEKSLVALGIEPFKIEIMTFVSGLKFSESFEKRKTVEIDGIEVQIVSISDLRINKLASGRFKDLNDLENLPDTND